MVQVGSDRAAGATGNVARSRLFPPGQRALSGVPFGGILTGCNFRPA
jgi:hypothetical protein